MVEANPGARIVIGAITTTDATANTVQVLSEQAVCLLKMLQPKSVSALETAAAEGSSPSVLPASLVKSEEFWKMAFAAIRENGIIQARIPSSEGTKEGLDSLLKMLGFGSIQFSNPDFDAGNMAVVARKPAFKAGGTSLKRKPKAEAATEDANPWANLDNAGAAAGQINEDSLMKDEAAVNAITSKFAADSDRIMPGKPCENCTCGKKELYEGSITKEQLETGQVESSCGSCYLGDAFRCAGCPFRGKPAFEPGEKVTLTEADIASNAQDGARTQAADQFKTAATGSTKVVLEL